MDIDLPVTLTQNDEVAFPVAVYNYLKTPQTVKLDLQAGSLVRAGRRPGPDPHARPQAQRGHRRQVPHPGQARSAASPLTVKAAGSKMSDAVKRVDRGRPRRQARSSRSSPTG